MRGRPDEQEGEHEAVTINVGGRVIFGNDDVKTHDMVSDPDLRHDECPPLNRVGSTASNSVWQAGGFSLGVAFTAEMSRWRARSPLRKR